MASEAHINWGSIIKGAAIVTAVAVGCVAVGLVGASLLGVAPTAPVLGHVFGAVITGLVNMVGLTWHLFLGTVGTIATYAVHIATNAGWIATPIHAAGYHALSSGAALEAAKTTALVGGTLFAGTKAAHFAQQAIASTQPLDTANIAPPPTVPSPEHAHAATVPDAAPMVDAPHVAAAKANTAADFAHGSLNGDESQHMAFKAEQHAATHSNDHNKWASRVAASTRPAAEIQKQDASFMKRADLAEEKAANEPQQLVHA